MGPHPHMSMYTRECILQLTCGGATVAGIVEALKEEGIVTCRRTVWWMVQYIENHCTFHALDKCGVRLRYVGTTVLRRQLMI